MIEFGKIKASIKSSGYEVETTLEDIEAIGESEEILDECLALATEILTFVPEKIFRECGMEEEKIKHNILENKRKMISLIIAEIKEEMEGE